MKTFNSFARLMSLSVLGMVAATMAAACDSDKSDESTALRSEFAAFEADANAQLEAVAACSASMQGCQGPFCSSLALNCFASFQDTTGTGTGDDTDTNTGDDTDTGDQDTATDDTATDNTGDPDTDDQDTGTGDDDDDSTATGDDDDDSTATDGDDDDDSTDSDGDEDDDDDDDGDDDDDCDKGDHHHHHHHHKHHKHGNHPAAQCIEPLLTCLDGVSDLDGVKVCTDAFKTCIVDEITKEFEERCAKLLARCEEAQAEHPDSKKLEKLCTRIEERCAEGPNLPGDQP